MYREKGQIHLKVL